MYVSALFGAAHTPQFPSFSWRGFSRHSFAGVINRRASQKAPRHEDRIHGEGVVGDQSQSPLLGASEQ